MPFYEEWVGPCQELTVCYCMDVRTDECNGMCMPMSTVPSQPSPVRMHVYTPACLRLEPIPGYKTSTFPR